MRYLVFAILFLLWSALLIGPVGLPVVLGVILGAVCALICSIADLIVVAFAAWMEDW